MSELQWEQVIQPGIPIQASRAHAEEGEHWAAEG